MSEQVDFIKKSFTELETSILKNVQSMLDKGIINDEIYQQLTAQVGKQVEQGIQSLDQSIQGGLQDKLTDKSVITDFKDNDISGDEALESDVVKATKSGTDKRVQDQSKDTFETSIAQSKQRDINYDDHVIRANREFSTHMANLALVNKFFG